MNLSFENRFYDNSDIQYLWLTMTSFMNLIPHALSNALIRNTESSAGRDGGKVMLFSSIRDFSEYLIPHISR